MHYTEEEKLELRNKLQELLNNSDPSIEAVCVSGNSVFTYSHNSSVSETHKLADDVAKVFGIDEDDLGGWDSRSKSFLKRLGGCFYAERN